MDTCIENSSINIIFGKIIKENIEKISKNINYIKYKNLDIQNNFINLKKLIEKNKKEFDCILIDANYNVNSEFYKNITTFSDDIIFLIEPNIIELEKSKRILEVLKYDLEIPNRKIKIIFNKVNKFQIDIEILKEIFKEYKILENIKYSSEYTLYINKNTKHKIEDEVYEKIYKKIFKE